MSKVASSSKLLSVDLKLAFIIASKLKIKINFISNATDILTKNYFDGEPATPCMDGLLTDFENNGFVRGGLVQDK